MSQNVLQIDLVSDVVCPWCFVGKRQLEQALTSWQAAHPETAVEVRWHPFQLNPDLPAEGMARTQYLAAKFGSADTAQIYTNVRRAAAAVDLELAMESISRQPNTLRPHALMEEAAQTGHQDALAEALFRAYFQEGRDLTDTSQLRAVAGTAGLSDEQIMRALEDDTSQQAVAQADLRARQAGIRGVPCFVFNGRHAVSGAQGAQALLEVMTLAHKEAAAT